MLRIVVAKVGLDAGTLNYGATFYCYLRAGSDSDHALVGVPELDYGEMTLLLFHEFGASGGDAVLSCYVSGSDDRAVREIRMIALKVGGGTDTALP